MTTPMNVTDLLTRVRRRIMRLGRKLRQLRWLEKVIAGEGETPDEGTTRGRSPGEETPAPPSGTCARDRCSASDVVPENATGPKRVDHLARARDLARLMEEGKHTIGALFKVVSDKWGTSWPGSVRELLLRFSRCDKACYFYRRGYQWFLTEQGRAELLEIAGGKTEEAERSPKTPEENVSWLGRARDLAGAMAHNGATTLQLYHAVRKRWNISSDKAVKACLKAFSRCRSVPFFEHDETGRWVLTPTGRLELLGQKG